MKYLIFFEKDETIQRSTVFECTYTLREAMRICSAYEHNTYKKA